MSQSLHGVQEIAPADPHCPDCGTETETIVVTDKYQGEITDARKVSALCEECMVDRATHPL